MMMNCTVTNFVNHVSNYTSRPVSLAVRLSGSQTAISMYLSTDQSPVKHNLSE